MPKRPPDLTPANGDIAVWLEQPNQVLGQVRVTRYTVEHARTLVGQTMERARRSLRGERLLWVSDSRAVRSYEAGARSILTDWALENKKRLEQVIIIVSDAHKLTLMGLRVSTVAAALASIKMSVLTSLDGLAAFGVDWPGETSITSQEN